MSAVALIRSTEVLIRSVGALIRSTEVLIRSAGALIRSAEVLIRSVGALIRSTEVLIRSARALIRTRALCHLITGLRQFYNYMSSVTYYFIIGEFLATLCVHDILYSRSWSRVSSFSYFISYLCFINTAIHFAFLIFFMLLLYMTFHILVQYNVYVFTHHSSILVPL